MPDEVTTVAPVAAPSSAPSQPASPQTPASSAPDPKREKRVEKMEEVFGVPARDPWKDETAPADFQEPESTAPAEAGHPEDDGSTAAPAPAAQEGKPANPADADLTELEKLAIKLDSNDSDKPADSTTEAAPTEADIEKQINPDGNATVEVRLKNAQSLIGKQGTELHKARTAVKQLAPFFAVKDGAIADVNLVGLADLLGVNRVNAQLQQAGLRLARLDEPAGGAPVDADADLKQAVDALMPGTELNFEEKWAEIKANPRLDAQLQQQLVAVTMQAQTRAAQQELQQTQQAKERESRIGQFFTDLKKLPYYQTELAPAIRYWNSVLPGKGDGALTGDLRLQVLYRLAQLNRMPQFIKQVKETARKEAEKAYAQAMGGEPSAMVPREDTTQPRSNNARRRELEKVFL